jgi:hypothetical protein
METAREKKCDGEINAHLDLQDSQSDPSSLEIGARRIDETNAGT